MIRATRPPSEAVAGWYEDRTAASFLDECARTTPGATAVIEGGRRLTYGELEGEAGRFARWLSAQGVGPGDVATLQLPNWWESSVVYQGVSRRGCVVNPVVPIYREHELSFILAQARPTVVVIPHHFRDFDYVAMFERLVTDAPVPPLVVVVRPQGPLPPGFVGFEDLGDDTAGERGAALGRPEDVCLLLYTSGTTADPKGVLHSHRTLVYEVRSIIGLCALGPADTVFMPSPVTHITGFLYGWLLPTVTGAAVVLLDRWDPPVAVDLIEQERCRFTCAATPFLFGAVEEYERRGQSTALRHFLCGGADVPPALVRRAMAALDCHVGRVYGSSEFPTLSCGRPEDGPEVNADTDGMPIGPVECRLEGGGPGPAELLVRGPDLFLGYLDPSLNEAAFTDDGYFRTGDLATIGGNGAITICGRQKDIIVRGGENVSAKEVEDLLCQHPMIREVAVVAMPDPVLVERACAFVVPVDGATVDLADVTAFLNRFHLARQKYPERVEIVAELPVTASGKVQKYVLRDAIRAKLAAELVDDPR